MALAKTLQAVRDMFFSAEESGGTIVVPSSLATLREDRDRLVAWAESHGVTITRQRDSGPSLIASIDMLDPDYAGALTLLGFDDSLLD